jgi:hypothetical protein
VKSIPFKAEYRIERVSMMKKATRIQECTAEVEAYMVKAGVRKRKDWK